MSAYDIQPRKEMLDVSKIFLAYLTTAGDTVATADVAQCQISDVIFLAKTELWDSKLQEHQLSRGAISESAKQRGREINRMANYIQAVRLRTLIDKTLQWIYENENNIQKFCQETNKQGHQFFSTRPLVELAKAAESIQGLTYRSLGDAIVREENGLGALGNIRELHLTVIEAMKNSVTREKSVNEVLTQADQLHAENTTLGYLDVEKALE